MAQLGAWVRTVLSIAGAASFAVPASAEPGEVEKSAPQARFDPDNPDSFVEEPDPEPYSDDFDESQRLRGEELQRVVPDITVRDRPSPIRLWFGGITEYPFQIGGVGMGIEVDATASLTFSVRYALGFLPTDTEKLHLGQYGEATLGLRVLSVPSEREVDVFREDVREANPSPNEGWQSVRHDERPELLAWLPSYHSLYLEAGGILGSLWFLACRAPCDAENRTWTHDSGVLWFPFGGLRYVYFIDVSSERKPTLTRQMRWDVFAHLIGAPAGDSREYTHWGDEQKMQRTSFGGRVGFKMPTCRWGRCGRIGFVGGYIPSPGEILFAVEVGN